MKKILKFGADWCHACKDLDKEVTDDVINTINKLGYDYISLDVDNNDNMSKVEYYTISSLPTLIILDDNSNILHKHIGAITKDELINKITEL